MVLGPGDEVADRLGDDPLRDHQDVIASADGAVGSDVAQEAHLFSLPSRSPRARVPSRLWMCTSAPLAIGSAGRADGLPVLPDDLPLGNLLQGDLEAEGNRLDGGKGTTSPLWETDLVPGLDFLHGRGHVILRMHDERALRGHGSILLEWSLELEKIPWGDFFRQNSTGKNNSIRYKRQVKMRKGKCGE